MDIMFVNEMPFLTTLTQKLHYRCAIAMANRKVPTIQKSLDEIFRLHNGHGVQISIIRCDQDFKPLFDEIKDDLDVTMDYTSAQDHQQEAERNDP